jgi:hypothetical protein
VWCVPPFLLRYLVRQGVFGGGVGPQARNLDLIASVRPDSVAAVRDPRQGCVDIADLLYKMVDIRQRDIDQQIGQRGALQISRLTGEFSIAPLVGF